MEQRTGDFINSHNLYGINNTGSVYIENPSEKGKNDMLLKKHTHRFIYISIVVIGILSIIAILLHFIDNTTISGSVYIGIITTLMGICTTFIVGFQIYNSIEYRAEIRNLQQIQEKYRSEIQRIDEKLFYESNEAYIGIYMVQGITLKDKYLSSSLRSFLKSIVHSLNVYDMKRAHIAVDHIVSLARQQRDTFIKVLDNDEIKAVIAEIKTHRNYSFIEDKLAPFLELSN